ncbi:MAG: hypothetical protein IPJ61_03940 [Tessaracoccus sp.]|uniref:hypothetical protein n=1 Tax=Tessaracoccus sp. TaxID=1971211 RepID=UPI001ECE49BA|nr:hypothetical protein [Tessaracoccus sp.]MBK7820231.1 hypothetical protein [Tessaracoccus sp.]
MTVKETGLSTGRGLRASLGAAWVAAPGSLVLSLAVVLVMGALPRFSYGWSGYSSRRSLLGRVSPVSSRPSSPSASCSV